MLNRYTKPERQRIPCVGKVRLGIKVDYTNPKTGKKSQIPRATDYFVIKGETEAEKQLNVLLGEKPKEIKIYFPFLHTGGGSSPEQWYGDWIERVFPVHYKAYSGSTKTKEGQLLLK
ncbi:MAG: hypothetical protein GY870_04540, partial [archaeon]|nr:hypothetical protein [archaeon]